MQSSSSSSSGALSGTGTLGSSPITLEHSGGTGSSVSSSGLKDKDQRSELDDHGIEICKGECYFAGMDLSDKWPLDTGATHHITNNEWVLFDLESRDVRIMTSCKDAIIKMQKAGRARFKSIDKSVKDLFVLKNVLSEEATQNIISIP